MILLKSFSGFLQLLEYGQIPGCGLQSLPWPGLSLQAYLLPSHSALAMLAIFHSSDLPYSVHDTAFVRMHPSPGVTYTYPLSPDLCLCQALAYLPQVHSWALPQPCVMKRLTDADSISKASVSADFQLGLTSVKLWWETEVD